jgi:hypothetical protein
MYQWADRIWIRPFLSTLPILILISLVSPGSSQATISLESLPDFYVQRDCLKRCFSCYECGVIDTLGCWYNGLDACFCRSDQAPTATSAISSCVLSACSGHAADVTSALSLYDGYCSRNQVTLKGFADPTIRNTISLYNAPDYKAQKNCLQACFGCYECGVYESIGCWEGQYDACFCRNDLTALISTAVTQCVNSV